jgi:hypothetical protein
MPQFVVRNHRARKKLTLTAPHSGHVSTSVTLTLHGRRVITLSDRLCEKYADSIAEYVRDGALLRMGAAPAPEPTPEPEPSPLLDPEVQPDEVDEDPPADEPEA